MKKVYVITETWYSNKTVVAVFEKKEDALEFIVKQNKPVNFQINEMEVK
jgi:hypothetical protein